MNDNQERFMWFIEKYYAAVNGGYPNFLLKNKKWIEEFMEELS